MADIALRSHARVHHHLGIGANRASDRRADRARRTGLMLAVGVMHLLAILWLANSRPLQLSSPQPQPTLKLLDVSAGPSPPEPVAPPPREAAVPPVLPVVLKPVAPEPVAPEAAAEPAPGAIATGPAGEAASAGGCALAADVGRAIQADPLAMAELAAMPPGMRTSADAVMLWDGRWLETGRVAPAAPGAIRQAVSQAIISATRECRDAPLLGPQIIPVPEPARTTMVVIGSGAWRWADLVRSEACPPTEPTPCRDPRPVVEPLSRAPANR